jgi:hypothetical protein
MKNWTSVNCNTQGSVAEPKLLSYVAPALTFKKFQLGLKLVGTVPVGTAFNSKSRVFLIFWKRIPIKVTCLILFNYLNYDIQYTNLFGAGKT